MARTRQLMAIFGVAFLSLGSALAEQQPGNAAQPSKGAAQRPIIGKGGVGGGTVSASRICLGAITATATAMPQSSARSAAEFAWVAAATLPQNAGPGLNQWANADNRTISCTPTSLPPNAMTPYRCVATARPCNRAP